MKWFFDSSVLLPVFHRDHVHHEASLATFVAAEKQNASCAAHSLAEVYSTLTRLPGKHRLSGDQALLFLASIRQRCTVIALDANDYVSAIEGAAAMGIVGGTTYDALLAYCALKADAETILTWNVDHFRRLGPQVARRVATPRISS
jgi:predicted nucleic acid-binding protein